MQPINKICCTLLLIPGFLCSQGHAREFVQDTVFITVGDTLANAAHVNGDSALVQIGSLEKSSVKSNSTKAVLFSFIPGLGQIYNRKYWKLPIVYGGYMGFLYAVTWNNKNYQDYWGAYRSIVYDSEEYKRLVKEAGGAEVDYQFNKGWTDFVTTSDYKTAVNNSTYHNLFKSRKDYFRRNRDLSIILTVGWFAICMVDAYVDAELFDFDISPSLSMRVEPIIAPATHSGSRSVGINCSITF
ncbi:MAG: DUF5683 domain-containing protein [Tannerellaceae bacterium]|jgi:hypothetical protein|nr:DUF5683 domain-containing protein [Tannerellaceae bacterium]